MMITQLRTSIFRETIYKFIYSDEGLSLNLLYYLRCKKKCKGHGRCKQSQTITNLVPVSVRPDYINDRSEFGYFEADLLIFSGIKGVNFITVIESKTRWSKIMPNRNKSTMPIMIKINAELSIFDDQFKSVTF